MNISVEHDFVSIDPQQDITYSPDNVDAYAEHLSDVNKIKEVVASEDILNQQGIVLLKKGQRITKDLVDRIVQHKLMRPIEDNVAISDSLNATKLIEILESKHVSKAQQAQHKRFSVREELERCCAHFFKHTILVQKLTVMSVQMPSEFDKAIVVAWAALIVSTYMKLSAETRSNVFIAALMHDIGMLHISREITQKAGNLTPTEWRAIKSHVIIGKKIMEQSRGVPAIVSRAIAEHHESSDGTGYPAGLFNQELCIEGQIVAMLDAVYAINAHKLAPKGLGTRALIPIFQINAFAYHGNVANAVIYLLRDYEHDAAPAVEKDAITAGLSAKSKFLAGYHDKLSTITKLLVNHTSKRQVRAAFTMLDHLNTLLRTSGILDAVYISELEQRTKAGPLDLDVEDFLVMLQELQWQLVKLTRNLHAIVEHDKAIPQEDCRAIQQALLGLPEISAR
jgi:HD-GYP domain-containing protein (c-di-GMP phosphodiesterase class II)